jgi:hypothetical protein
MISSTVPLTISVGVPAQAAPAARDRLRVRIKAKVRNMGWIIGHSLTGSHTRRILLGASNKFHQLYIGEDTNPP